MKKILIRDFSEMGDCFLLASSEEAAMVVWPEDLATAREDRHLIRVWMLFGSRANLGLSAPPEVEPI